MKKLILLALPLLLTSCGKADFREYKVIAYDYAYQTSEVQEYTHDIRVAKIDSGVYVEVPDDYKGYYIQVKPSEKITYYYVYGEEQKVSNGGWVLK